MVKTERWTEFFLDCNVRFPDRPRLLESIDTYVAPYGLGVRFVGGPQPITIRGERAADIFTALRPLLDGSNHWRTIVETARQQYDTDEVVYVLTALHANSLLRGGAAGAAEPHPQTAYYERVRGRTGFNENGREVERILATTKLLVFTSGLVGKALVEHLSWSGYRELTVCTPQADQDRFDYAGVAAVREVIPLPTAGRRATQEFLSELLEQHRYVTVALPNPADWFVEQVNRLAIDENVPAFYFSFAKEKYEIGPFVIPRRSACVFCKKMRANSYQDSAVMDNVYQDSLAAEERVMGTSPGGDDYITTQVAVSYFISEVNKAVAGYSTHNLVDSTVTFDPIDGKFSHQRVVRIPGCPECG